MAAAIEIQTNAGNASTDKDHTAEEDIPLTNDFHKDTNQVEKTHRPNSEEDGKHHHIHFGRITARRGRKLAFLFLSKLILAIAHLCTFIYCVMHVFH